MIPSWPPGIVPAFPRDDYGFFWMNKKLVGVGWFPQLGLEELVRFSTDRMAEECKRDLRGATLLALPAVDTGV